MAKAPETTRKTKLGGDGLRGLNEDRLSELGELRAKANERENARIIARAEISNKELTARSTEALKRAVLALFRSGTRTVTQACEHVGISRRTHYAWREKDAMYEAEYQRAMVERGDILEEAAYRRAVHGAEKPVFQGGVLVGVVNEYSDALAALLLKGAKPEKYKERHEHSGPDGGPIETKLDLSGLTTDELITFRSLLAKASPGS